MAGNTGKLTTEALEARGPRLMLLGIKRGRDILGYLIAKEGVPATVPFGITIGVYARSFSIGYLLRIGRAQRSLGV